MLGHGIVPDKRVPAEYKHGKKRAKVHDDIQLVAQATCLEEMTGQSTGRGMKLAFQAKHQR